MLVKLLLCRKRWNPLNLRWPLHIHEVHKEVHCPDFSGWIGQNLSRKIIYFFCHWIQLRKNHYNFKISGLFTDWDHFFILPPSLQWSLFSILSVSELNLCLSKGTPGRHCILRSGKFWTKTSLQLCCTNHKDLKRIMALFIKILFLLLLPLHCIHF